MPPTGLERRAALRPFKAFPAYRAGLAILGAGYTGAVGKIGDGTSTTLYCYVFELDETRHVESYEIRFRPSAGVSTREESGSASEPADDCSEIVWGAGGHSQH